MAAVPWRSVGAASAEPSAATVRSTPSHTIESVLIAPTIAEKRLIFQAYHTHPDKFRGQCAATRIAIRRKNGWTWHRAVPSPAILPSNGDSCCGALAAELVRGCVVCLKDQSFLSDSGSDEDAFDCMAWRAADRRGARLRGCRADAAPGHRRHGAPGLSRGGGHPQSAGAERRSGRASLSRLSLRHRPRRAAG